MARRRLGASPLVGTLAVGQPRADARGRGVAVQAGQGAADGGRRRHRETVGRLASGAQRGADHRRGIRGPLGGRGQAPILGPTASPGANTNVKYVAWPDLAAAFDPPLLVDPSVDDPRR
jgi:hypothetical protein